MASIIERTILSETEKRLSLTGEQAGRLLVIGDDWQSIRVAIRYSINTTTTLTLPSFFLGLCSGNSLPCDAVTSHFLGVGTQASLPLTGTGGLANVIRTSTSGAYTRMFHIVDGVSANSSTGATSDFFGIRCSPASNGGWSVMSLEITKGSPDFTITGKWSPQASSISAATFISFIGNGSATGITNTMCNTTRAVDEATDGFLDTIALSWGHASIPVEISDIAYARLS